MPSITLAGAAEEVLGENLSDSDKESAYINLKTILSEKTGLAPKIVSRELLNKTKNWLKHWNNKEDDEKVDIELENEAINYIIRAATNLVKYDNSVSSEFPLFWEWLINNRPELLKSSNN